MRSNVRKTKKRNSRGFTMVELMVTLAVMGILLAITFVGLNAWIRNSEFKKCNEYAHTIYTAASLELSSLELASDLDRFTAQVQTSGTYLQDAKNLGNSAPEDVFEAGRMYALTAKAGEYRQYCDGTLASAQANLVYDLIDNYSYDKEVCDYTITIEYDSISETIYAVYVSSWAKEFVYADPADKTVSYDERGIVNLNATGEFQENRSYEVRKDWMIGYYCVEELGIKADFNERQLRAKQCYLDNGETLDLVVSSNSRHMESDVKYMATIYKKSTTGDQKLFDVTFSLVDLLAALSPGENIAETHLVKFQVIKYESGIAQTPGDMYFPISFVGQELRLTLDATMSAQTVNAIESKGDSARNISTSFQRFLEDQTELPDIYATVRVEQLTESDLHGFDQEKHSVRLWIESEEYVTGSSLTSDSENAFYASVKEGTESEVGIGSTRHLANIRYYDPNKKATFQLVEDLQFADAVIYELDKALVDYENATKLMKNKAFPSIPKFSQNWKLTGKKMLNSQDYAINGIVLTEESVLQHSDTQLGIIMQNDGEIRNLSVGGSDVLYGYVVSNGAIQKKPQDTANTVYAAGVLCGLNNGTIHTITMDDSTSMYVALNYQTVGSDVINLDKMNGIGLVCGVHNGNTALTDIQTAGELEGYFYDLNGVEDGSKKLEADSKEMQALNSGDKSVDSRYRFAGIGGVSGLVFNEQVVTAIGHKATFIGEVTDFLNLTDSTSVKNKARVTGNYMVGGLAGNIRFKDPDIKANEEGANPIIENCANEGLIHLSGEKFNLVECGDSTQDAKLNDLNFSIWADNCFAGGIVGFLQKGVIKDCTSAPGVSDAKFLSASSDETLYGEEKIYPGGIPMTNAHHYLEQYLTGNFVGGIAGCVVDGELRDCRTNEGGYVLGNDEVGGIVGYLTTGSINAEKRLTLDTTKEVQNGCSVLGHSNVGGIVGSNQAGNKIQKCVNEGVVVGSGRNIGGIAGRNIGQKDKGAIIEDCTSEVFDYDGSIYQLVTEIWQIYGDNAGGLVGFNEYGEVKRGDASKTNVSAIVVGNNNVGGVFGMAGVGTKFDFANYTLDGGEVYARFDSAGGYIGANLSEDALPAEGDGIYGLRPYSVRGRYAVGGVIGSNVLLQNKTYHNSVIRFSNMNSFGTVYGANAVGGIIGYQRNVIFDSEKKYKNVYQKAVQTLPKDGMNGTFALITRRNDNDRVKIDGQRTVWFTDCDVYNSSDSDDYPLKSGSVITTLTGNNASTVIAGSYGGGILGYGCANDSILVKDCTNTGDVSDWQADGVTGAKLIEGSVALLDVYTDEIIKKELYSYDDLKQALTGSMVASEPIGSFVGGIQGFVSNNTTVSNCTQEGMIYARNGFGGIAGINLGKLENCQVLTNLGTQESSLVGGVAAINGTTAIVKNCNVGTATTDYTIEGKNIVGGFFAINESTEENNCSQMFANISCALDGSIVGGLAGINAGNLAYLVDASLGDKAGLGGTKDTSHLNIQRTPPLQIGGGSSVGGVAGVMKGQLAVNCDYVISDKVSVTGTASVGGLFGELCGGAVIDSATSEKKTNYKNNAAVTANDGCAGGIAGKLTSGQLYGGHNLASVTAYGEKGYAGGVVAYVGSGGAVIGSVNDADVSSMNSCAGGICAWNEGTITDSSFVCENTNRTISSNDKNMGIIAAYNDGMIQNCDVKNAEDATGKITLQGSGNIIGGIVGTNRGTIADCEMLVNYKISTATEENLILGGAIGQNEWISDAKSVDVQKVEKVKVENYHPTLQGNCAYFGGLIGLSTGAGIVSDSQVKDITIKEANASLRGSCYGGAIGSNASSASAITVKNIVAEISGLYQANITLEAEKQENLASCFGGIVGKNETSAVLEQCSLDTSEGYDKNKIVVANGLVGGITGINKGIVQTSGYKAKDAGDSAVAIAKDVQKAIAQYEEQYQSLNAEQKETIDFKTESRKTGFDALEKNETVKAMITDRRTMGIPSIETMLSASDFTAQKAVTWMKDNEKPAMLLQLTGNGSIGGITAYNTASGEVQYCMTGHWLIDNRSSSQYSAQGGIIGTNESDQDTCFLVNQAIVLRESSSGVTERVNGGIIGNQHNMTSDQWTIFGCINTGMVINYNSHYSGGIIGRWSDCGGTVEYCRNYGVMQTSYQRGWKGASGGIAAQLYHPLDNQSYTILSCRNDGSIFGVGADGRNYSKTANESGGIMGNIVIYEATSEATAQNVEVNFIDCVNGPDVTIICNSMGGGILGYTTSDKADKDANSVSHLQLNFDRCRNYCTDYDMLKDRGFSGIFGDRDGGHELTRITNCFTLANEDKMNDYGKKGYIVHDGGASNGVSYQYDGGKSTICYNNRVLLVDSEGKVDASVRMNIGETQAHTVTGDGICFAVLNNSSQKVTGDLAKLLKGEEKYTISGSSLGPQLYIQLNKPMMLGELEIKFSDKDIKHSYRVEYLTDSISGESISNNFTLAKEVIGATGETETVSLPKNVPIYALRLQYVQKGVASKADSGFLRYGYYYSNSTNTFTLSGLTLTTANGQKLSLESYGKNLVSTRLVDGSSGGDHLRNGSTQYLYVATQGNHTYLIEPQFEDASNRLSAGSTQRKKYSEGKTYQIDRNELFDANGRPYGMIYANATDSILANTASAVNCEKLDQLIANNYRTSLAAAMPLKEGSLLPETPISADLTLNAEDASIDVSWNNSIDGARNTVLYYLLTITGEDGTEYVSEKKCIGNEFKLNITSDMIGKKLQASVRAVNENGTSLVYKSDWSQKIPQPMITPQIRLELVCVGDTYKYEVSLENHDSYMTAYGDQWQVNVYRQGNDQSKTRVGVITNQAPKFTVAGADITDVTPSLAAWQLSAQACYKGNDNNDKYMASVKYSTSVYTPTTTNTGAIPGIKQLYATFDEYFQSELDANLNVYVSSNTSKTGIYPVYQIDLIRVAQDGTQHILASKELAVSEQLSNLTFSDLPTEFFDGNSTKYFYVRAWVSQTGVGPVYTWHETDSLDAESGSLLVNTVSEDEKYVTAAILANASDFGTRVRTTNKPGNNKDSTKATIGSNDSSLAVFANTYYYALADVPKMNSVHASYSAGTDQLYYAFEWSDTSEWTKNYELQVYGKSDNSKVLIKKKYPIAKGAKQGKEYVTSAKLAVDDWKFSELEVVIIQRDSGLAPQDEKLTASVSRKGKTVPRASVNDVTIRTRLPQINQPSVKLLSQNDLKYQVSWQDVSSRVEEKYRDQIKYALYLYNESDKKTTRLMPSDQIAATTQSSIVCDLEDYAGSAVQLYAVAYVDAEDYDADAYDHLKSKEKYFKSMVGLKKRLVVGTRLAEPEFENTPFAWNYRNYTVNLADPNHVLTEAQFTSNALKLDVKLKKNRNYVINGVLFETEKQAQDFIKSLEGTPYSQYVKVEQILADVNYAHLSGNGKPIMMNLKAKQDGSYTYTISPSFKDITYAGGYIVPLVRSTSTTNISSYWSWYGTLLNPYYALQIPKVQLNTPHLNREMAEKTYATFGESFRNSVSNKGTPFSNVTVQYDAYRFSVPSYVQEDILTLTTDQGDTFEISVKGNRVDVYTNRDMESTNGVKNESSKAGFDYFYTYTLSGTGECSLDVISNAVKGTYQSSGTTRAYYRMEFDTGIRREEVDGNVSYVLRLPQTRYAINCNGRIAINGTGQMIRDVFIQAIPKDGDRYKASKEKS